MSGADAVLERLVGWFGPAGAVSFILALVVGYFYRRDLLSRDAAARADRDRLVEAVTANAQSNSALAGAVREFTDGLRRHEETETRVLESLEGKLHHSFRSALHEVMAIERAARERSA